MQWHLKTISRRRGGEEEEEAVRWINVSGLDLKETFHRHRYLLKIFAFLEICHTYTLALSLAFTCTHFSLSLNQQIAEESVVPVTRRRDKTREEEMEFIARSQCELYIVFTPRGRRDPGKGFHCILKSCPPSLGDYFWTISHPHPVVPEWLWISLLNQRVLAH